MECVENAASKVNGVSMTTDLDIDELLNKPRAYSSYRRNIALESSPDFTKRLEPFCEVPVGVPVVLECRVSAFPVARVRWYMDDQEVFPDHPRYILDTDTLHGIQRLVIERVSKTDEGAFKCKAENQEGVASTTGYLSVTGTDKRQSSDKSVDPGSNSGRKRLIRESAISTPPPLCTIIEQKSVEEMEARAVAQQGPSPIQGYINNIRKGTSWTLINMMHLYHSLTSSKDEEDGNNGDEKTDAGDSGADSEPSTPTGECDQDDLSTASTGRVASWEELTQSLARYCEQNDDVFQGSSALTGDANRAATRSRNDCIDDRDHVQSLELQCTSSSTSVTEHSSNVPVDEDLTPTEENTISLCRKKNMDNVELRNDSVHIKDDAAEVTQLQPSVASSLQSVSKNKASDKRQTQMRRQRSLSEITLEWCLLRLSRIFGAHLDSPAIFYIAFIVVVACLAGTTSFSPVLMVLTIAGVSIVTFIFVSLNLV